MNFFRRRVEKRQPKSKAAGFRPRLETLEDRLVLSGGNGLQFNITTGSGSALPSAQMLAGFQQAANHWSAILADDVTLNVRVELSGSIPLGGAGNTGAVFKSF